MRYFFALTIALAACNEIQPGPPPAGVLRGTISGTNVGPLAGITVSATVPGFDAQTAVTTSNGTYELPSVTVGAGQLTLSGYPTNCGQPAPVNYTAAANETTFVNVSVSCPAQLQTGTVVGSVTSSLGSPIANAQVTLTPSSGTALQPATTDANGNYAIVAVPAGNGSVAVTSVGANCTVPAPQSYSGLTGGGSVTVNVTVTCTPVNAAEDFLVFDGLTSYASIPSAPQLSVSATGITVAVWMRPDTLAFAKTSGSSPIEQYVHWLGKGEHSGTDGDQEWTFRMYSQVPGDDRGNRISFYVFDPTGHYGCGSYFQDAVVPGQWIHVVGVIDVNAQTTAIYKNGVFRHSDSYTPLSIVPTPGSAPMRLGSKDGSNFFKGAIGPVRVWNRPLTASEVAALYSSNTVPQNGLVAAYGMTEGQGTTIVDSVAANNGTLFNTAWGQGPRQPMSATTATQSGGGC